MQTIVEQLEQVFRSAITSALGVDADPQISPSQNDKFGDYQANAAMGLAKKVNGNPRAIAEKIKVALKLGEIASEITIAGPGFLNIRLSAKWVATQLGEILKDDRLGVKPVANPLTVVVDYSGPNIAKQMHVGHLRSTIIGDAISRVIEFQGHRVIRQNHIGDWGTQFGMLIAFLRASGKGSDTHIADLEDFYRQSKKRFDEDAAFADEARKTVVRLQGGGAAELEAWRKIVNETWLHFAPVYERLGVKLRGEDARGESFYNPMLPQVVQDLKSAGLAKESEGATVVFNEGFENPLLIEKTGGGYLYATTDLAAIRYRTSERKADRIVYTHDSRQAQHFAQVFATARAVGWAKNAVLEYAPFGTMLGEDQKPFKSRSGELIKLKDLLEEAEERAYKLVTEKNSALEETQRRAIARAVGIGGVKYSDLSKDRISDYVFSWEKMLALDGNTAPYLQYAYARIRSIFRKAGIAPDLSAEVLLDTPFELALAKHILRFGEIIEIVARELKPHHLSSYLYELATKFSAFYENCPVLQADPPARASRLVICEATARTLALGLELLGIEHPEQM